MFGQQIKPTTTPFQFHTGSIKSPRIPASDDCRHATFQFHTGSIKSHHILLSVDFRDCFNSILVRLKDKSVGFGFRLPIRFQFHTGSIKSTAQFKDAEGKIMFQFHTGSIKS